MPSFTLSQVFTPLMSTSIGECSTIDPVLTLKAIRRRKKKEKILGGEG
jgi:hypothetical protein